MTEAIRFSAVDGMKDNWIKLGRAAVVGFCVFSACSQRTK